MALLLGRYGLPMLFRHLALTGFVVAAATLSVLPITMMNALLLAGYAGYTGLVLYCILALRNPLVGPAALDLSYFDIPEVAAGDPASGDR